MDYYYCQIEQSYNLKDNPVVFTAEISKIEKFIIIRSSEHLLLQVGDQMSIPTGLTDTMPLL